MSLWSIDDKVTAELMHAFVRHLRTRVPAKALREAMLETRKSHPHPSYWASFAVFGVPF
jgi:CHAT domain-containing protein